jgi:hypothetical protein
MIKLTGATCNKKKGGSIFFASIEDLDKFIDKMEHILSSELGYTVEVHASYVNYGVDPKISTNDIVRLPDGSRHLIMSVNGEYCKAGKRKFKISDVRRVHTKTQIIEYYIKTGATMKKLSKRYHIPEQTISYIIDQYLKSRKS